MKDFALHIMDTIIEHERKLKRAYSKIAELKDAKKKASKKEKRKIKESEEFFFGEALAIEMTLYDLRDLRDIYNHHYKAIPNIDS